MRLHSAARGAAGLFLPLSSARLIAKMRCYRDPNARRRRQRTNSPVQSEAEHAAKHKGEQHDLARAAAECEAAQQLVREDDAHAIEAESFAGRGSSSTSAPQTSRACPHKTRLQ